MVIEQVITLGNLIVILIVIVGFIVTTIANVWVVSSKTSKFVMMTEMKFAAGEKKFVEHDKDIETLQIRCNTCPMKIKYEHLEEDKNEMKEKQIELRAKLPVQLDNIEKSIVALRQGWMADLNQLRDDLLLAKRRKE